MSGPARAVAPRGRLQLSRWAILGLAALGLPRAVTHDLDLVDGLTNTVLTVVPFAVWLGVGIRTHPSNPFPALVAIGFAYGLLLALSHQLLWTEAYDGRPPRLGGNLEDLPDGLHAVITRAAAFVSSLATGAAVGAILGLLGLAAGRARRRHNRVDESRG